MRGICCTVITHLLIIVSTISTNSIGAEKLELLKNYGTIPLAFTLNVGLYNPRIKFISHGNGCSIFFTGQGTTFLLVKEAETCDMDFTSQHNFPGKRVSCSVNLNFLEVNPQPEIIGENRLSWNNNYFYGSNSHTRLIDVPNYEKVRMNALYDGIDLIYYSTRNGLKYDFIIKPGAQPERIVIAYDIGNERESPVLSINEAGDMVIITPLGKMIEKKPYCYQMVNDIKVQVDAGYELLGEKGNCFTFRVVDYDHDHALVIDPELVFSTYIGGGSNDWGYDMVLDECGCAYIAGMAKSNFPAPSGPDYPTTHGAYDISYNGGDWDAVVTKINAAGDALIYSTFIGGSDIDFANGIAIDDSGNIFITGRTLSSNFPVTRGAYDESYNGGDDSFVAKLNTEGNTLLYSTFLGESGDEWGMDIALDGEGNSYVTGWTESLEFPTTPGAYNENHNGKWDAFITKINRWGTDVMYSTFIGGSENEWIKEIVLDSSRKAYITGFTWSPSYPVTTGAYDESHNGNRDVMVTCLNSSGSSLVYSTFIGGYENEWGKGIVVDGSGSVTITGFTYSSDFPVTSGAYDQSYGGMRDAFVTRLNASGSDLLFSTFLGGSDDDRGEDIAVDAGGNAYITGKTIAFTSLSTFPVTSDAFDASYNQEWDIFLSKLDAGGSKLLYSSLFGGVARDWAECVALDNRNSVYITGYTWSPDFPVTAEAFDETYNGRNDTFVLKVNFYGVYVTAAHPGVFRVYTPYPNPFNPTITIRYELPVYSTVELVVYDILGNRIKVVEDGRRQAGINVVQWDGKDENNHRVGSGVYLYELIAGNHRKSGKVLHLR